MLSPLTKLTSGLKNSANIIFGSPRYNIILDFSMPLCGDHLVGALVLEMTFPDLIPQFKGLRRKYAAGVVAPPAAPDDHIRARPDCGMYPSPRRRTRGGGGSPAVCDRVIYRACVEVIRTVVPSPSPDYICGTTDILTR